MGHLISKKINVLAFQNDKSFLENMRLETFNEYYQSIVLL